jgi:hypothetical protein
MNIDFLREGSVDCPIIRLYDGQYEDYEKLLYSITRLINDGIPFDVLKLEGFQHDSTINSLIIQMNEENKGVIESPEGIFHCYWSKGLLLNIIEIFKIYQKKPNGYFWLDDHAESIDVLLSYSGKW